MFNRIGRVSFAIAIIAASIPLSLLAVRQGFGLGATLIVPTCCLGFWFSLVSPGQAERIGWFAFSSVSAFLLPMCSWWEWLVHAVLTWIQGFLRGGTILYSGVETVAVLSSVVLPWATGCVLGWHAAKVTRKLLCATTDGNGSQRGYTYRFTLRGMLLSIMVCAGLIAWLSSTVRQWHVREDAKQELFLGRFERSFTTGNVKLLDAPRIDGGHAVNSGHISHYRVIAPIKKQGNERWAVWTYWCDEEYPGTISNFGYAEAATENALPPQPFPVSEYLTEPNYSMTDGEPELKTKAEIVAVPKAVLRGSTFRIVAKTKQGMECDLVVQPFYAATSRQPRTIAPPSGVVSWDVQLDPKYRGTEIDYEFQARANALYRAKIVGGEITLVDGIGDEQKDERERE